jgi:hypothetical protein
MYKEILRSIAGIEIFPLLSLFVFLAVFVTMLIWTVRLDARRLDRLSRLPLDRDDAPAGGDSTHQGATR